MLPEVIVMDSHIPQSTDHVPPKYPAPLPIAEINYALGDLQPLAPQIHELKKEILEKESEVLRAILEKIVPLIPLVGEEPEACYRRNLAILKNTQRVNFEGDAAFYSEHQLILYENGALVDQHRYGENTTIKRIGWEITDEHHLTPAEAIVAFSLGAISEGLIATIKEASQLFILKEELESKLDALINALEALQ